MKLNWWSLLGERWNVLKILKQVQSPSFQALKTNCRNLCAWHFLSAVISCLCSVILMTWSALNQWTASKVTGSRHLFLQVHDGYPLRLWKVMVEVPATPEEVLTRVLREQGHWDEDLLESRVVETLDDRTEVYQYVRNSMAPHPTRDHVVLR